MADLEYDKEAFVDAVSDLIPAHQTLEVMSAINADDFSEADYEELGLSLTGERHDAGFITHMAAPNLIGTSMWAEVKKEVYDYICTSSKKYAEERKEASITIKNVITLLATAVASSFNVAVGVVTGAVTIALLSALKIGKNSWCNANKPE